MSKILSLWICSLHVCCLLLCSDRKAAEPAGCFWSAEPETVSSNHHPSPMPINVCYSLWWVDDGKWKEGRKGKKFGRTVEWGFSWLPSYRVPDIEKHINALPLNCLYLFAFAHAKPTLSCQLTEGYRDNYLIVFYILYFLAQWITNITYNLQVHTVSHCEEFWACISTFLFVITYKLHALNRNTRLKVVKEWRMIVYVLW